MPTETPREMTDDEWADKLTAVRSEVQIPGYWGSVAENCARWSEELSVGPFWALAKKRLDQWRTEYRTDTDADLLPSSGLPNFSPKAEKSIRDKLFRRCRQCPDYVKDAIRKDGPPIPCIDDLVRTRVSCRFIDGVEFLASKFVALATEMMISVQRERKGRIDGYFAQHVTVEQEVFFRFAGSVESTKIVCEIQVASELATRMWDASHPLYEIARSRTVAPEKWQWDAQDPHFIANQLGHMIHLADGLLVHLRQSSKRRGA
jgi:hypothetical protein